MKAKIILPTLVIQLIVATMAVINFASTLDQPTIKVEPSYITAPMSYVGETFSINITVNNVNADQKLIEVEFRLSYDPKLLEVIDVTEGPFLTDPRWNLYGTFWVYYVEDVPPYGPHIIVGNMIYPNETGEWNQTQFPEGSGTIATITFREKYQPLTPEPSASCELKLMDTMILNVDGDEISHNTENGYYTIEALPVPVLTVEPNIYVASSRSEVFNINVTINDVDERWRLIEVEFRLSYDPKLLEVIDVTEGPFLTDPRWNLYGTFWVYYVEDVPPYGPHIIVGNMIYPNETGEWNQTQFPEGSGTIATITFREKYQMGRSSCNFEFMDTMLLDVDGNELLHNVQNGRYRFPVEILYHSISWEEQTYIVVTESNATVNPWPMYFDQLHKMLYFTMSSPDGAVGYCNVTIPKVLLNAASDEWLVIAGGCVVEYQVSENTTHTSLYFTCPLSTEPTAVYIFGMQVIPEFSAAMLTAFLAAILFIIVSVRFIKSRKRKESMLSQLI